MTISLTVTKRKFSILVRTGSTRRNVYLNTAPDIHVADKENSFGPIKYRYSIIPF